MPATSPGPENFPDSSRALEPWPHPVAKAWIVAIQLSSWAYGQEPISREKELTLLS